VLELHVMYCLPTVAFTSAHTTSARLPLRFYLTEHALRIYLTTNMSAFDQFLNSSPTGLRALWNSNVPFPYSPSSTYDSMRLPEPTFTKRRNHVSDSFSSYNACRFIRNCLAQNKSKTNYSSLSSLFVICVRAYIATL
jgi:hypothetical protein